MIGDCRKGREALQGKRLATGITNLRRVIVTIGRSDVQLSHSISVRRRTIKKDPKYYDVLEDASIVRDLWTWCVACYMLHAASCGLGVGSWELGVGCWVLSADESIWLAREEGKDNRSKYYQISEHMSDGLLVPAVDFICSYIIL